MISFDSFKIAESPKQAYELNLQRNNRIIGGMMWLRMSDRHFSTVIDLSKLGLDKIDETNDEFIIGAMTTLRDIEKNAELNQNYGNVFSDCVKHIVGVQFRNLATIGGSIYGRFGFSDVLTAFLAFDSYAETYKHGIIPLSEFAAMPYERDLILNIRVKKDGRKAVYDSFRNESKDFPVIAVCVSEKDGKFRASVGARPAKAKAVEDKEDILSGFYGMDNDEKEKAAESFGKYINEKLDFNTNMRASEKYRRILAEVYVKRCLFALAGGKK
jgi:CO/xanthine dehydrogenase FAD-binding subunit